MVDQSPTLRIEDRALTAVRGVAALAIVFFHLSINIPGQWPSALAAAPLAVDVFFLLSGYILTAVYAEMQPWDIPLFLWNRIARIFPLHVVILAVLVAGILGALSTGWQTKDPSFFAPTVLPYHFTLTFVWLGLPPAWNSPAWSLSVEFAAYLVFPLWLLPMRRVAAALCAVLCLALLVGDSAYLWSHGFVATGAPAIIRGFLGFGAGSALCLATVRTSSPLVRTIGDALLDRRPIVWLGRISYSVYLLHAPLLIVWMKIIPRSAPLWLIPTFLAALLATSHMSYHVIERPARDWLKLLGRRLSLAAPSLTP